MEPLQIESVVSSLLPFPLPASVSKALARTLGFKELGCAYTALRSTGPADGLAGRMLHHLGISYRVAESDLDRIPAKGPAIVVANHPFGILEGAVLADMLQRVRHDVRFLANSVLRVIPELQDLIIPVDTTAGPGMNRIGLRRALEFVIRGGMLVVFPAGEVSHFQWRARGVADPDWNTAVAGLARVASQRGSAPVVVPAFVAGRNSLLFQAAGVAHPQLRTALLVRELLNKRNGAVEVRLGPPVPAAKLDAMGSDQDRTEYLRWRTYLLAKREQFKPEISRPLLNRTARRKDPEPVIAPVEPTFVAAEIAAIEGSRLASAGDLEVYLTQADAIPAVLREIGRLREITFRAAGEGTGKAVDLDAFDHHYLHLFVWNRAKCEVVGAYRLAPSDTPGGLYTATLFEFDERFLKSLGPALELGRSFIRTEYQRSFNALLLLWKGIGAFVARNPKYRVLFGPVSISNDYRSISRDLMVGFLEKRALLRESLSWIRARNAPEPPREPALCGDVEELSEVVADLEPGRKGVPILLRHYLRLGGRLLGFNVDSAFSNALDGLILVDLTRTEPKLLERYLGRAEAATFLSHHGANHGVQ